MKNRVTKAQQDYQKRFYNRTDNKGAFYYEDICEIKEAAEKYGGGRHDTLSEAILAALEAGFMVGYRCAKREARKTRKGEQDGWT